MSTATEFPIPERDVLLWFWNDRLHEEHLLPQVDAIAAAGFSTIIPRTYVGLTTPYLGEEFHRCLGAVMDRCASLGLHVWLQAGFMPYGIDDLPEQDSLRTCSLGADGRAVIERVAGNVDLLSVPATARYIERAYQQAWYEPYADRFGSLITGLWVDEPKLKPPALPWSPDLIDAFRQRHGEDLDADPELIYAGGDTGAQRRRRFWILVQELMRRAYFEPMYDWCAERGVACTGHLMGEDHLRNQIGFTAGCMPYYRHFHIPGIDFLTADLSWPYGPRDGVQLNGVLTPIQAASAAAQAGQAVVHAEEYGTAHSSLDFGDMCRIGDWLLAHGINLRVVHSTPYSLRGRRKRHWPPALGPQQAWWSDLRPVNDRFARLGQAMRRGQAVGDLLVLHPLQAAYATWDGTTWGERTTRSQDDRMDALQQDCVHVLDTLLGQGRIVHLADDDALAQARIDENRIVVGACRYRALVLSDQDVLLPDTNSLIEQALAAGIPVYATPGRMQLPAGCQRLPLPALAAHVAVTVPAPMPVQIVDGAPGSLRICMRDEDGRRIAFLHNGSETAPLHLRLSGNWQRMDLSDGTLHVAEREPVLPPTGSILLEEQPQAVLSETPTRDHRLQLIALSGDWDLQLSGENTLVLDRCRLQCGQAEPGAPIPINAVHQILREDQPYAGPIALHLRVHCQDVPTRADLVWEDWAPLQLSVNGMAMPAGIPSTGVWVAHRHCPIAAQLRPGDNHIRLDLDFDPERDDPIDIEELRLVGDFAVGSRPSVRPVVPPCARIAPELLVQALPTTGRGDCIADGLPFMNGRVRYRYPCERLHIPADAQAIWLELPDARSHGLLVELDDQPVAHLLHGPWRCRLDPAALRRAQALRITVTTSLRNTIAPVLHRPQGEPRHHWGALVLGGRWCAMSGVGYENWYLDTDRDTDAWTDDYLPIAYGLGQRPHLRIELPA
ncbi:MAG: hypothetical protein ACOCXJ_00630 [Planctomycetota bacterium]